MTIKEKKEFIESYKNLLNKAEGIIDSNKDGIKKSFELRNLLFSFDGEEFGILANEIYYISENKKYIKKMK